MYQKDSTFILMLEFVPTVTLNNWGNCNILNKRYMFGRIILPNSFWRFFLLISFLLRHISLLFDDSNGFIHPDPAKLF